MSFLYRASHRSQLAVFLDISKLLSLQQRRTVSSFHHVLSRQQLITTHQCRLQRSQQLFLLVNVRRSYASAVPSKKQPPQTATNSKAPLPPAKSSAPSTKLPATSKSSTPTTNESSFAETKPAVSFTGTDGKAPPTPAAGAKGYPERLLIYNAGSGRTVFIAAVKLTAIFLFIFSTVMVSPAYYYSPHEPTWMAAATFVGGAIPLMVMVFSTPPFVTYVHLALPSWARASYPRLIRYARNLPGSAQVDVTTLRWIWPRVTRLTAQELYVYQSKVGSMTLRRNIPQEVKDAQRWYSWRPLKKFYVAGQGGKAAEKGIWEEVMGAISRGWGRRSSS